MKRSQVMRWTIRFGMPGLLLAAPVLLTILSSCSASEGEALFDGREPLAAHLMGDPSPLPARVTRCVSCHEPADKSHANADLRDPHDLPRLDQRSLLGAYARRGGPPTHFTQDHFCSLLRDGVDPASIVISTAMPRYEIDAKDCGTLWLYMLSR